MADNTKIEWADATGNAVNGCSVVSPGCTNCYAMKQAHRFPARQGLTVKTNGGMVWTGEVRLNEKQLLQPLRWRRPRRIFWNAHGDLFHDAVPDEWIDRVFAVCALTPQHQHLILTKRSARMREYVSGLTQQRVAAQNARFPKSGFNIDLPLPNVWLGVSAEDQTRADQRIPDLLATPAAVRFISAEPLLGPVDLRQWNYNFGCSCGWGGDITNDYCPECGWIGTAPGEIETAPGKWHALQGHEVARCPDCNHEIHSSACPACNQTDCDGSNFGPNHLPKLDWVIAGGESGPNAHPMHPDWARALRDQCQAAAVPFFFKQWGEWMPTNPGRDADDRAFADGSTRHALTIAGRWQGDFYRIGKKAAGRLLDGREWNEVPA